MKIEHAAYQVADPARAAEWYVAHLGMTVKRAQRESPFMHFLADSAGAVMIEFYNNPAMAVPDYRRVDPILMHLAFHTDDVAGARARLLKAGATAEGDMTTSPAGDDLAMLRDPWGFPVQLVRRKVPMLA